MQTSRLIAKPQKGRINLGWSAYQSALGEAHTMSQRKWLLGHSPGMAASLANVSRQAIHDAIDRGQLTALYIHDDNTGNLKAILIPDQALDHYIQHPPYQRSRLRSA